MSSPFVAVRAVVRPSGPASFLPSLREHTHTLSLSLSVFSFLSFYFVSVVSVLVGPEVAPWWPDPKPRHETVYAQSCARQRKDTKGARRVCPSDHRPASSIQACVSQHRVWSSGHCAVPLLLRTQQPAPELASINIFCSLAEKTTCGAGKVTKPNTQTQDAKSPL